MRRVLMLAVALLAGCGEHRTPSGPGGEELTQPFYTVSGSVVDSVLGAPLAGIRVLVGDSIVTTDANGAFRTWQRRGSSFIRVHHLEYEVYDLPMDFINHRSLTIALRGRAPYALQCQFFADTVRTIVLDLQGRKTLNRRTRSRLAISPGLPERPADTWLWRPVDDYNWTAAVVLGDTTINQVEWRLADQDGFERLTTCHRTAGPCQTCGGTQ